MKVERKPLTFWASFYEKKSQLLYLDYFKMDKALKQIYYSTLSIVKSIIIFLTRKQYCNDNYIFLSFITMIIQFGTVLLYKRKPQLLKKSNFINTILEGISSFDILMIQDSPKRETEEFFLIKLIVDLIFLQSSALIQFSNWQQSFKRTTIVILFTVIIRYMFFSPTFNLEKLFIIAVVLILLQLYLLVPIVQIEGKIKTLWIQWSDAKKQFKAIDNLLIQLPVPVIIFNEQFQVLIQSQLAYRILPKEVDIVEKKYFNKPIKIDHISLPETDIQLVKQTAFEVIKDGQLKILQVSILGQQGPSTFYLQRVLYKRSYCILMTCIQNSDEQTIDYNHAIQDQQLKLLDQMSFIISKEEKYKAQVMILKLMSIRCPLSIFPYSQQCNVNFNLKNYLTFYMDMLSMSCLDNISLSFKYNSDLPVIVSNDILRLHYTLMQLVAFVSKQYMNKQKKLGSMKIIDVRGSEKILEAADNIDNMFMVCEKQVIEGQQDALNEFTVRIGFEFNFTNPISETQMIFQDFDYKNSHQVAEGGFYHIYRIAKNSFGGDLQVFEKSQTLKIDLIIPFHHQEGGATHNALLTQYQSQGKCSEGSKNLIQWVKEDFKDWKQVKIISSHSDSTINAKRNKIINNVNVIHEENSKLQSDDDGFLIFFNYFKKIIVQSSKLNNKIFNLNQKLQNLILYPPVFHLRKTPNWKRRKRSHSKKSLKSNSISQVLLYRLSHKHKTPNKNPIKLKGRNPKQQSFKILKTLN